MRPGKWIWLFPLTYLAHIGEEVWGGAGFAAWIGAVAGVRMSAETLVVWNAIGWLFMTLGVALASRNAKWRWALTAISGIVFMNALLHAIASLLTRSYSPGLTTSLILWVPLGLFTLRHEWRHAARSTFLKGLAGAIVFHILVAAVLLESG